MSDTKEFLSGDKVFAKLKGYPPWPSRIIGIAGRTSKCIRYQVYFYGTRQTAVVKDFNVCSYLENRDILLKAKKQKHFAEAVKEIDEDLRKSNINLNVGGLIPSIQLHDNLGPDDTLDSTVIQSSSKVSGSTEKSNGDTVGAKVNLAESKGGRMPVKKKKSAASSLKRSKPSTSAATERTSKADTNATDRGHPKQVIIENQKFSKNNGMDFISATDSSGEKLFIPLRVNRPKFENNDSQAVWDKKVWEYANSLKERLESGLVNFEVGNKLSEIRRIMEEWTLLKCLELIDSKEVEGPKKVPVTDNFLTYKTECRLLDIDVEIKRALSITEPCVEKALILLQELEELPLTPLMLKKHAQVVNTVRRSRNYVGNNAKWNLSNEELKKFKELAKEVRENAIKVYNIFKKLFNYDVDDGHFYTYFTEQVELFRGITSKMCLQDILSLTKEPEVN